MEQNVSQRVDNHELRLNQLELRIALNENNIENLNKKLDKIDTNITKLNWLVIGAVVLAILNSVLRGGVGQ